MKGHEYSNLEGPVASLASIQLGDFHIFFTRNWKVLVEAQGHLDLTWEIRSPRISFNRHNKENLAANASEN